MIKILKQTTNFVRHNKIFLTKLAFMGYVAFSPEIALASTTIDSEFPFASGITKIYNVVTGPLAQVGAGLAVAVAGYSWMQGDSQMSKTSTRVCLGTGCALGAPTLVDTLAGGGSGALF